MKVCRITDCNALLLGMSYFVLILDDGRSIAVCPNCYRKVRKLQKSR